MEDQQTAAPSAADPQDGEVVPPTQSPVPPKPSRPAQLLERGYYNESDREFSKRPFRIFLSLAFPFLPAPSFPSSEVAPVRTSSTSLVLPSGAAPSDGSAEHSGFLEGYPPLLNVNVVRVVDLVSAIAMTGQRIASPLFTHPSPK